ncbi:MAG: hypothetical protein AB1585_17685 [Thermodesulfobacteriota bacterium]
MVAKKSLIFAIGLFVISVWIWGSATPALSETINCKGEGKSVPLTMINDSTGSIIGINESKGSFTCDSGETGTEHDLLLWEQNERKELLIQGYSILTFKDNSKIIMKSKFTEIPDPKGEAQWIFNGTSDILRGNMRFNGIKGSGSFKGRQNGYNIDMEWTLTFTLPKK